MLRDLCVLPSLSCPTEKASTSGNQHTQPPLASCQAGQRVRGDWGEEVEEATEKKGGGELKKEEKRQLLTEENRKRREEEG